MNTFKNDNYAEQKGKIPIKFARFDATAVVPSKREEDAGYDVYPLLPDSVPVVIPPGDTVKIHTGIASVIPKGYVAILKERSSTGSIGLQQRSGVIDSGYRGEWIVVVTNGSNKTMVVTDDNIIPNDGRIYIRTTKAIAQAVIVKLPNTFSEEITMDELQGSKSERMSDGFGSTDK